VPEEMTTQLTAVESRLAAREQIPVSESADSQVDTSYQDKVSNCRSV